MGRSQLVTAWAARQWFGMSFHGTDGSLVIRGSGYTIYDMRGKEVETGTGDAGDTAHFSDFLDAVRSGRLPNADIEIAHQSTLLCHLGNIAYRTNSILNCDPANGHILKMPRLSRFGHVNTNPVGSR